jgi:hypothetical protein
MSVVQSNGSLDFALDENFHPYRSSHWNQLRADMDHRMIAVQ